MLEEILIYKLHYFVAIILMLLGLYAVIAFRNLIKKVMGLMIFQTSALLFYIALSKVENAIPPILKKSIDVSASDVVIYENPVPHVLMLTAIVVGVAIYSVAFAIIFLIKQNFNSLEEEDIL